MMACMEPLLYEAGVDLVIAGHVHAYERSVSSIFFNCLLLFVSLLFVLFYVPAIMDCHMVCAKIWQTGFLFVLGLCL